MSLNPSCNHLSPTPTFKLCQTAAGLPVHSSNIIIRHIKKAWQCLASCFFLLPSSLKAPFHTLPCQSATSSPHAHTLALLDRSNTTPTLQHFTKAAPSSSQHPRSGLDRHQPPPGISTDRPAGTARRYSLQAWPTGTACRHGPQVRPAGTARRYSPQARPRGPAWKSGPDVWPGGKTRTYSPEVQWPRVMTRINCVSIKLRL